MDNRTVHSFDFGHSFETPHKYPDGSNIPGNETNNNNEHYLRLLGKLSIDLYPTGRAWNQVEGGEFRKLHEALNISFLRLINKSERILDGIFPDNKYFDENDASLWEYRLGLISNDNIPLVNRVKAIKRKFSYPNDIRARQHPLFIQSQLQQAGFDVYVHENVEPYVTPENFEDLNIKASHHSDTVYHGPDTFHSGGSFDIIANSLDQNESYSVGGDENLWATFFIGGENFGDLAEISSDRIQEFRELVLKLKPGHLVAFLLINYI